MREYTFDKTFAAGADVSWLPQMEAAGFPFKNREGNPQDCLLTLKEFGIDSLRLRAWVNPSDDPWSGHCSTGETLAMALRGGALGVPVFDLKPLLTAKKDGIIYEKAVSSKFADLPLLATFLFSPNRFNIVRGIDMTDILVQAGKVKGIIIAHPNGCFTNRAVRV